MLLPERDDEEMGEYRKKREEQDGRRTLPSNEREGDQDQAQGKSDGELSFIMDEHPEERVEGPAVVPQRGKVVQTRKAEDGTRIQGISVEDPVADLEKTPGRGDQDAL